MSRILILVATAALVVAGSAGTAVAADGPSLCIGDPSHAVTAPDESGACKKGTLTPLADAQALAAIAARVDALESANSALQERVGTLESDNTALAARVSALETTLSKVSYDATGLNGRPTLTVSGANLQVVDGSGDTLGRVNGLGNLFVGYGERSHGDLESGSHNLVIGRDHSFSSVGGLIAGVDNTVTGTWSTALGSGNTASGTVSTVTGGRDNVAGGSYSSVSGGQENTAGAFASAISGGNLNTASGSFSSISGGAQNTTTGGFSSLLGGRGITLATQFGTSP